MRIWVRRIRFRGTASRPLTETLLLFARRLILRVVVGRLASHRPAARNCKVRGDYL